VLKVTTGISHCKVRLIVNGGEHGGGAHIPGTLKDEERRAPETKHLPLWEFYGGNLRTTKDMPSKALEMEVCFNRGPILGEHGGGAPFLRSSKEGRN